MSGSDSGSGWGHFMYVVVLGKNTSVHSGVQMSTGELNIVGNHTVDWQPIELLHVSYAARQEQ